MPLLFEGEEIDLRSMEAVMEVTKKLMAKYGTVLPSREALYFLLDAKCPKCGRVGNCAQEFGIRSVKEEKRSQSYCKHCRATLPRRRGVRRK